MAWKESLAVITYINSSHLQYCELKVNGSIEKLQKMYETVLIFSDSFQ
jgi:hypothetical protein